MTAPASQAGPLLEVEGLRKHYASGASLWGRRYLVRAVESVSFTVKSGETLGLVGESGSGKSTVGRCVMQLERPTAGEVRFAGQELTRMKEGALRPVRRRMQIVFQDPYAALNPRMTVGRFVAEPIVVHEGRVTRADLKERVEELFRIVGLDGSHMDRYPHEFSGGQRQRVGIARAMALGPDLIVADEPITALDVSIQAQIVNLFQRLQDERGIAYLFISHDLAMVRHLCHRVAVMLRGIIVETGPAEVVLGDPRHPYTQALISAAPGVDPEIERGRRRTVFDSARFEPLAAPEPRMVSPGHWVRL